MTHRWRIKLEKNTHNVTRTRNEAFLRRLNHRVTHLPPPKSFDEKEIAAYQYALDRVRGLIGHDINEVIQAAWLSGRDPKVDEKERHFLNDLSELLIDEQESKIVESDD